MEDNYNSVLVTNDYIDEMHLLLIPSIIHPFFLYIYRERRRGREAGTSDSVTEQKCKTAESCK